MSNKFKNCGKVKNACKYCLENVTNKNGLQCHGACKKWAHFKCLNYTPGKISDIKAGVIKVMCPCPDCETNQEKEFLTNPPFSCSNHGCPANIKGPVKCESADCPLNRNKVHTIEEPVGPKKPLSRSISTSPRPDTSPPLPTAMKQSKKQAEPISDAPDPHQNSKSETKGAPLVCDDGQPKSEDPVVHALQEMCGTVGKLSIQIRDLMGQVNKLA